MKRLLHWPAGALALPAPALVGVLLLLISAALPAPAQDAPPQYPRHTLRLAASRGSIVGIPATSLGGEYSYYLSPRWSIGAGGLRAQLNSGNQWLDASASGRAWVSQLHTTVGLLQGARVGLEARGGGYYMWSRTRHSGSFVYGVTYRTRQEVGVLAALRPTVRCSRWLTLDAGPEVRLSPSLRTQPQIGHTARRLFLSVSAQVVVGVQVHLP